MGVKRPRGGQQQRLSRAAAAQEPALQSFLASFLIQQFAWGHFSGQMVQQIAELAIKDVKAAQETNGKLTDLESLAAVGTKGKHSQHVHRDIMKQCEKLSHLPQGAEVNIPFGRNLGEHKQHILLPHELFSCIYHKYKNTWAKSILPGLSELRAFWESNQDHPNMENHPLKLQDGYQSKCIPLGLHGDEVPVVGRGKCWSKSLLTFQWVSLLAGSTGTVDKMMWIWAVFDQCLRPGPQGTLECFWEVLVWSLSWLMKGTWPSHDWKGNRCFVVQNMFWLQTSHTFKRI
jgi:hypothetical protein